MRLFVIALLIFFFAFFLRTWNLHDAGRWSDEEGLAVKGHVLIELIKEKNFSAPFWYKDGADHPPLFYYIYGLASYKDIIGFQANPSDLFGSQVIPYPVFQYDFSNARMVSVIMSSLTIVIVFLIGVYFFSLFTGIASAIIFSMLPHFLGYSQFVGAEVSVTFFFTVCVVSYLFFLKKQSLILLFITGILSGLCVEVKQSNVLIFIFYLAAFYLWKKYNKNKNLSWVHLVKISAIAFVTFVLFWPSPWLHLPEFIQFTHELWFKGGLTPDLFFGQTMGARFYYYFVAFLITTPVIVLILTFLGIKQAFINRKKWIFSVLLLWFLIPFLMMFFHHRQHMVRYIVEFYAPLSLLAGIGMDYFVSKITKRARIKYILLIPLIIYLFIILARMTPYYLEYYNELVGGTKNVYEKKLFFLGWFGEGLKRPGEYVAQHAETGSRVGLKIEPYSTSVYKSPKLNYAEFKSGEIYDYVIVNYYSVVRAGFDEDDLKQDYKLVYSEKVVGADLAKVYKRK